MKSPTVPPDHDDRYKECRSAITEEYQALIHRACGLGWNANEAVTALAEISLYDLVRINTEEMEQANVVLFKPRRKPALTGLL